MSPPASVSRVPAVPNSERVFPQPPINEGMAPVQSAAPDIAADAIDRSFHAALARFTGGVSPAALALAFADWQVHLLASPGKRAGLVGQAIQNAFQFFDSMVPRHATFRPWSAIRPPENDRRFSSSDWELPSYNLMAQAFLLTEQWWHSATTGIHGLSHSNATIADFTLRQCLDTVAPTNFAVSNPEVLRKVVETGGGNFLYGIHNWIEDFKTLLAGAGLRSDRTFEVGKDVAVTPGKVVYRNELIELIQYSPMTPTVRPEPVLIVPAWIMKYYILDLSARSSLVHFLIERGFTVFMISWKNPTPEYRNFSLEDYRELGVDAAIATINALRPGQAIHAAGYCLGGTLLSIAAARLARERPDCLRTMTLLAAQTDFTDAGDLTLFINESQVSFLEDMMWRQGLLGTAQMAGAFQILRSNDMLWSRIVRDYLIGERAAPSELMSWNADATRMPYQMHSDYLRRLFLNNDLAAGRYQVNGQPVALSDLHMPMFVVGTRRDHVAPWKSTYKINFLANADTTFVLTSGGHNAGIVAPPHEEGHSYQVLTKKANDSYLGPDEWVKHAPSYEGSWWIAWARFLVDHSGQPVPASWATVEQNVAPLGNAPGTYVLEQ